MRNENYSLTISQGSKWIEDVDGAVKLEYGKAYVVRLKNRTNTPCGVDLYIDGKRVANGQFYVGANSYIDVKGYYNGVSREFVFEPLTANKKGDFDGEASILEARFYKVKQTEKEQAPIIIQQNQLYPYYKETPYIDPLDVWNPFKWYVNTDNLQLSNFNNGFRNASNNNITYTCSTTSNNGKTTYTISLDPETAKKAEKNLLSQGFTRKGKKTDQKFNTIDVELEDKPEILTLNMYGYFSAKQCSCGYEFKSNDEKYCSNCGKKR